MSLWKWVDLDMSHTGVRGGRADPGGRGHRTAGQSSDRGSEGVVPDCTCSPPRHSASCAQAQKRVCTTDSNPFSSLRLPLLLGKLAD